MLLDITINSRIGRHGVTTLNRHRQHGHRRPGTRHRLDTTFRNTESLVSQILGSDAHEPCFSLAAAASTLPDEVLFALVSDNSPTDLSGSVAISSSVLEESTGVVSASSASDIGIAKVHFDDIVRSRGQSSEQIADISTSTSFTANTASSIEPGSPTGVSSYLLVTVLVFTHRLQRGRFIFIFRGRNTGWFELPGHRQRHFSRQSKWGIPNFCLHRVHSVRQ